MLQLLVMEDSLYTRTRFRTSNTAILGKRQVRRGVEKRLEARLKIEIEFEFIRFRNTVQYYHNHII